MPYSHYSEKRMPKKPNDVPHLCREPLLDQWLIVWQASLLVRLLRECSDVTPVHDLEQVLRVMAVLAAENDLKTLQDFSNGLADAVLSDVVIAHLDHLPTREKAAATGSASGGMAALEGLLQVPLLVFCYCFTLRQHSGRVHCVAVSSFRDL